jgi:alkylation response protein AidB-like acyl-CoA dehydrogenase
MRLDYTDDQRTLGAALRAELSRRTGDWESAEPDDADARLARLGIFGLQVPGAAGGLELGSGLSAVVAEELGRQATRDRYRCTALLADVLAAQDDGERTSDLLAAVAAHEVTAAAAAAEPALSARLTPAGLVLSGRCVLAGQPTEVTYFLVPADTGAGAGRVFAVIAAAASGLVRSDCPETGLSELRADGVVASAASPMTDIGGAPAAALVRARIRQAAYLLGLAQGAHGLGCLWVARRRQFGRAIGDNQALAFPLAEQMAHLEAARLLVHRACWSSDHGHDAALAATEALAYSAEMALEVTSFAVHVHGAFGLTRQAPVHRYYQAAAIEALRWGSPAQLWRQAAELRG